MSTVNLNSITLVNADSLEYIKTLSDNCIDLIATDPPYFKVKPEGWDNQWHGDGLDRCLTESWRVLKPTGSLYLFCGHRIASDIELLMRQCFNVLNHIIWAKPFGRWNVCNEESLRAYFPATERVLFAEHYSGPYKPKDTEYAGKCATARQDVMTPLIEYFRSARAALNVSAKEINQAMGKQMASHWFSASQWQLPSEKDYLTLQALFSCKAEELQRVNSLSTTHNQLTKRYQVLSRTYADLVAQYEEIRRPFAVTVAVPYTDVWTYKPVQFYLCKHPCEKPAEMMRDIIAASSKPGDVVADFFMGSGSTVKAAIALEREVIGVELETERFNQTVAEIEAL